jgi:hypothetical protein
MPSRRHFCLAALPLALPGRSAALELPDGAVVLTLSGQLRHTNRSQRALLDMAMIERLPQQSYSTRTPWFTQPRKYTGPLLRDLLASVGAQGSTLRCAALNDYEVDIPWDDVVRHEVLLARLLDDKPMSVREKGPLLIIYPFDQVPALRTTLYYSRCAWQLKSIHVT